MMYLNYDSDRALELLRDYAEDDFPNGLNALRIALDSFEDTQALLDNGDLPLPVSITAAIDADGTKLENIDFIADARFTRNGIEYFSNGYFAAPLLDIHEEERGLLEQVVAEYTA